MGKAKYGLRAAALASVVAMSLAACGGGSSNGGIQREQWRARASR